jgi:hypothetical protein
MLAFLRQYLAERPVQLGNAEPSGDILRGNEVDALQRSDQDVDRAQHSRAWGILRVERDRTVPRKYGANHRPVKWSL